MISLQFSGKAEQVAKELKTLSAILDQETPDQADPEKVEPYQKKLQELQHLTEKLLQIQDPTARQRQEDYDELVMSVFTYQDKIHQRFFETTTVVQEEPKIYEITDQTP